jgi:predicted patatin/cPLA2 family phospholipase
MSEKPKIKRALHSINNVSDKLLEKVTNYGYFIEDLSKKAANRVFSNAKSLYGKVTKSGSFDLNKSYESSELQGKYRSTEKVVVYPEGKKRKGWKSFDMQ